MRGATAGVLAAVAVVLCAGAAGAQLAWLDPASVYVQPVGVNVDVTARVQGIPDLWGVDFWITYDQGVIQLTAPIAAGVCPAPDLPLANTVDNVGGVGHYAVSAFGSGPCDCAANPDQAAAVFNFTRVATGLFSIDYSLADPPGVSVLASGSVEVCNESTPDCWQNAVAWIPVELLALTVE